MQQILVVIALFLCFRFQFFNRQASIEKRMFAHKPSFFLHIACDCQRFGATELLVFYLLEFSLLTPTQGNWITWSRSRVKFLNALCRRHVHFVVFVEPLVDQFLGIICSTPVGVHGIWTYFCGFLPNINHIQGSCFA